MLHPSYTTPFITTTRCIIPSPLIHPHSLRVRAAQHYRLHTRTQNSTPPSSVYIVICIQYIACDFLNAKFILFIFFPSFVQYLLAPTRFILYVSCSNIRNMQLPLYSSSECKKYFIFTGSQTHTHRRRHGH